MCAVLATPASVTPKRRPESGSPGFTPAGAAKTDNRLDEAQYQYIGGPNKTIEVGQAGVSNSPQLRLCRAAACQRFGRPKTLRMLGRLWRVLVLGRPIWPIR